MIISLIHSYIYNRFFPRLTSSKIPFIYIDITNHCNSKCITCDIWKNKKTSAMSLNDWLSFFNQLPQHGVKIVSIGGGEPTLNQDLPEMISHLKKLNIKVHLNTHLAITDSELLSKIVNAGIDAIHVSIDSASPSGYKKIRGIDYFLKVEENVKWLLRNSSVFIGINSVIGKHNIKEINSLADWARQLKVQKLQFIPVSNNLQQRDMSSSQFSGLIPSKDELSKIKSYLKINFYKLQESHILTNSKHFIQNFEYAYIAKRLFPCYAGRAFLTINSEGFLYGCYEYGTQLNIKDYSLKEVLNSNEYKKMLKKVKNCKMPCHDVGSAEINIRLIPKYFFANAKTIYSEIKSYIK